jgi:integrase
MNKATRTRAIHSKGRNKWILLSGELHDNIQIELNWNQFIEPGIGSNYQRTRLIAGTKNFLLARLERSQRKWSDTISASYVNACFSNLRTISRWMVSNGIWRFADLSPDDVIEFLRSRRARHSDGIPTKGRVLSYITLFEDLWIHRHSYHCAICFNVREFEDEIWIQCPVRDEVAWKGIDEMGALALLSDSLDWIRDYGRFFIDIFNLLHDNQKKWIGISQYRKSRLSTELFRRICEDPIYLDISAKCGTAKTGAGLARAFTITLGAAINFLLLTIGFRVSELVRLDINCVKILTDFDNMPTHYVEGIAAKAGGARRSWVVGEPIPEIIGWLEELYRAARSSTGLQALFISRSQGSTIPLPGRKLRRMSSASPITAMLAFSKAPFRKGRPTIENLHPHAARKTFASFVVSRDKSALESLSLHFGHAFRAFTDGAYAGNLDLQKILAAADRQELGHALSELLSSSRLAGRGAFGVEECKISSRRFKGKLVLQRTVDALIQKGVQLAPCNWGYCLYSQSMSACQGSSSGPNEIRRSPDVCAGCMNFVVSKKHESWWNSRAKRDEEYLQNDDLPDQTREFVTARLQKSKDILRQLLPSTARRK